MKNLTVVLVSVLVILIASACASTRTVTEPIAVIEAFHDALNDGDLDAAMSFVADDAEFISSYTYSGKAQIRGSYEQGIDEGRQVEITEIRAESDKVSWTTLLTTDAGTFEPSFQAVVQEGLIVTLTLDM